MIDLEKEREEFIKVYTEIYGEHDQLWQGWKKRAELAQAEITELKQKLEKLESGEFVLVPRNLSNELWEVMWKEFELSESMHEAHKAMIEAVEKQNAQQDS